MVNRTMQTGPTSTVSLEGEGHAREKCVSESVRHTLFLLIYPESLTGLFASTQEGRIGLQATLGSSSRSLMWTSDPFWVSPWKAARSWGPHAVPVSL